MARRRKSNRRRRGSFVFLYKLLSVLVICGAVVAALTLFFRVETIRVSGQQRYTEEQVRTATGIQTGDNLYLLNKNEVAARLLEAMPYIETIRINRDLPDELVVEISEYGTPMAVVQDGKTWIVSVSENPEACGKIMDCLPEDAAADYGIISGCQLLSPAVGEKLAMEAEQAPQQESLLALMSALKRADMLEQVDGIRLDDPEVLRMDYIGRFTVKLPYQADYAAKLDILQLAMDSGKVQDNMTGTFDMMREDGRTYLDQSTR